MKGIVLICLGCLFLALSIAYIVSIVINNYEDAKKIKEEEQKKFVNPILFVFDVMSDIVLEIASEFALFPLLLLLAGSFFVFGLKALGVW